MGLQYLWCRAWPWFTDAFPFARCETLEAEALERELTAMSEQWHGEHEGELLAWLTARARETRMQRLGRPTPPNARRDLRLPKDPEPAMLIVRFKDVGAVAKWTLRPSGLVVSNMVPDGPRPTTTAYFRTCEYGERADEILEILRLRIPRLTGAYFGSAPTLLRFGRTSSDAISRKDRVLIRRSLVDNLTLAWLNPIRKEAEQIEADLAAEDEDPTADLPHLSPAEAGLLYVLDRNRKEKASSYVALKHLPALIRAAGWKMVSPSRLGHVVQNARERGFDIRNNANGAGYRLIGSLAATCRRLGFAMPVPPSSK